MLMADLAVLPAGLHQAHCQPVGRLAKVHEHCSAMVRARFPKVASLPSGARYSLLAALASSWRTARHSITSSARASSAGRNSSPSAFRGPLLILNLRLVRSSRDELLAAVDVVRRARECCVAHDVNG